MLPFDPRKHRNWLYEPGLPKLVPHGVSESAHLDFKSMYSRSSHDYADTLRVDAAALATSGDGYLVIGVAEFSDRRGVAESVVGLPNDEATKLAQSMKATLLSSIDPPLHAAPPRCVPVGPDRSVVVLHVKGRRRYPVCIERVKGGTVFYVREGMDNHPLKQHDALVRRRELDLGRFKPWAVVGALAIVALMVAVWVQHERLSQAESQRQLTVQDRNTLLAILSKYPGRNVTVQTILGDAEGALYAEQFVGVLQQANWNVHQVSSFGVEGVGIALDGGEADPASNRCRLAPKSTMAVLGYALGRVVEGIVSCNPALSPSSEQPMLSILRNPAGPAARHVLQQYPQLRQDNFVPLSRLPAPPP